MSASLVETRHTGRVWRLLAALLLLLLCIWAASQAVRAGWASFRSIEARTLLKRAMNGSVPVNAQTWNLVREGLVVAIEWDPDNPEYHQALADLYLLRLIRTPGGGVNMGPYFDIALKHYFTAAALRPTWPYAHSGIVTAKQQMGRHDAAFLRAISLASRYGPWEKAVQDQLIVAGYRSWSDLGDTERDIIRGNLRRAHDWRPDETADLLARLKLVAPPCDQLRSPVPSACSSNDGTAPAAQVGRKAGK